MIKCYYSCNEKNSGESSKRFATILGIYIMFQKICSAPPVLIPLECREQFWGLNILDKTVTLDHVLWIGFKVPIASTILDIILSLFSRSKKFKRFFCVFVWLNAIYPGYGNSDFA